MKLAVTSRIALLAFVSCVASGCSKTYTLIVANFGQQPITLTIQGTRRSPQVAPHSFAEVKPGYPDAPVIELAFVGSDGTLLEKREVELRSANVYNDSVVIVKYPK